MVKRSKSEIISLFETDDEPTGQDFKDLIDSTYNDTITVPEKTVTETRQRVNFTKALHTAIGANGIAVSSNYHTTSGYIQCSPGDEFILTLGLANEQFILVQYIGTSYHFSIHNFNERFTVNGVRFTFVTKTNQATSSPPDVPEYETLQPLFNQGYMDGLIIEKFGTTTTTVNVEKEVKDIVETLMVGSTTGLPRYNILLVGNESSQIVFSEFCRMVEFLGIYGTFAFGMLSGKKNMYHHGLGSETYTYTQVTISEEGTTRETFNNEYSLLFTDYFDWDHIILQPDMLEAGKLSNDETIYMSDAKDIFLDSNPLAKFWLMVMWAFKRDELDYDFEYYSKKQLYMADCISEVSYRRLRDGMVHDLIPIGRAIEHARSDNTLRTETAADLTSSTRTLSLSLGARIAGLTMLKSIYKGVDTFRLYELNTGQLHARYKVAAEYVVDVAIKNPLAPVELFRKPNPDTNSYTY